MKNKIKQEIIKEELEKQIGEPTEIIKIDDKSIDVITLNGIKYWAKLTKIGNLKKNSIRLIT